jgi:hypothetical protein
MTGILDPLTMAQETDSLASGPVESAGRPAPEPTETGETATTGPELEQVRQLVLRAYPDIVPELVTGASITDLLASIGPAEAAYANLASRIGAVSPQVPAGTVSPAPVDLDRLPIAELLRRGLAALKSS